MTSATVLCVIMTIRILLMTFSVTDAVPMSPAKITKGCPDPVSPKRGTFRQSEDKTSVEFLCQPGLTLIGRSEAICIKGRVWSEQPPVCVGGDCEISAIRDASVTALHGGGIIRIQCRPGFSLTDGTGILACIDRQWNSTKPRCIDKKKELQSERRSKYTNNLVGKHSKSESRDEEASSSKRSHKDWLEASDYSCVRRDFAVHPPSVPNARAVTRWSMYDGLPKLYTAYHCKWGFKPTAGGLRNVYCRNGEWVGSTPKCQTVVYEEPRQMDFAGNSKTLSHEELLLHADYTCIAGSSSSSSSSSSSNHDDMVNPPVLENTLNNALRFSILEGRPRLYFEYTCEHGFELENGKHAHLYCREKRWIGEKPKCVPDLKSKNSCAFKNGGCSQLCHEGVCSCKQGYRLTPDKVSCTGVDECEVNNGDCDHLCENTDGSFECSCYEGYALQPNKQSCSKIRADTNINIKGKH